MNLETLIAPTDLRDFAKGLGWVLLTKAAEDRLYVMTNPRFERRQLVFPMDTTAPDYCEAVVLAMKKLAVLENRTEEAIFDSLVGVGDDGLSFRISTPRPNEPALPLTFASSMVAGAQKLLLASACTVLKPQAHHPRLGRSEAQQVLETAKFRHTRPGSFVLNVSCPVKALDVQAPVLLREDAPAPFVRRTTAVLHRSLRDLVKAVETDTLAELVEASKNGEGTLVSSNLCEAVTQFEESFLKNSVEIGITWAASIPRPKDVEKISLVRIQHDYFPRIEEVRRELRAIEQHVVDVFPATVERLDGEMGEVGKRSGEVILRLLTPDGDELVRARANLTTEQYAMANQAHMSEGVYVKVAGKLHPGRQPRQLTDISAFELLKN